MNLDEQAQKRKLKESNVVPDAIQDFVEALAILKIAVQNVLRRPGNAGERRTKELAENAHPEIMLTTFTLPTERKGG